MSTTVRALRSYLHHGQRHLSSGEEMADLSYRQLSADRLTTDNSTRLRFEKQLILLHLQLQGLQEVLNATMDPYQGDIGSSSSATYISGPLLGKPPAEE